MQLPNPWHTCAKSQLVPLPRLGASLRAVVRMVGSPRGGSVALAPPVANGPASYPPLPATLPCFRATITLVAALLLLTLHGFTYHDCFRTTTGNGSTGNACPPVECTIIHAHSVHTTQTHQTSEQHQRWCAASSQLPLARGARSEQAPSLGVAGSAASGCQTWPHNGLSTSGCLSPAGAPVLAGV